MSVLNAIKGKLVNAKKDLSESFRSLTSTTSQASPEATHQTFTSDSDADVELLSRYQNSWQELHSNSEDLRHEAQSVDNLIANMFQFVGRRNESMNQFLTEITSVDRIFEDITKIKDNLDRIGDFCGKIESMLTELEGINEYHNLFAKKCEHEYQLKKFERQRHLELEQTKVNLASRHSAKVRQFEEYCNANLLERQKVFNEVHNEQMKSYKMLGYVDLLPSPSQSIGSNIDLADININDDQIDLDQFLESSEIISAQTESLPVSSQLPDGASLDEDDQTSTDELANISNLTSLLLQSEEQTIFRNNSQEGEQSSFPDNTEQGEQTIVKKLQSLDGKLNSSSTDLSSDETFDQVNK